MKKIYYLLLCTILTSFYAVSCSKEQELRTIHLSDTEITISEGNRHTLTAKVVPSSVSEAVTWTSMDESIATVDADGTVTGIFGGRTFIYAKAGKLTKGCSVTVVTNVSSVKFQKHSLELAVGDAEEILYDIEPERALSKALVWSSQDPGIAFVSNGVVVAKSIGKTQIKAYSVTNPDAFDICEVEVIVPVSEVTISDVSAALWIDETFQLSASVLPHDATYRDLAWSSSDESIATVDSDGLVRGISAGRAVIAATTLDGKASATCEIEVRAHVTGISLDATSFSIFPMEQKLLTATILPADAFNTKILWNTSDAAVAVVDENGLVTGVAIGHAVITATTEDGGFSATCDVDVKKGEAPIESISFEKESYTVVVGRTTWVIPVILPVDAADKSVTWESSDTSLATIASDGTISGIAKGTVTIIATSTVKPSVKGSFTLHIISPQSFDTEEFDEGEFQDVKF